MSTFKKIFAAFLFFIMLFTACFAIVSCRRSGGDKSKIIIVSEETFNSEVKLTKYGYIEKEFSAESLSKSEVEYLEAGKKYYALIYLHKIKFWQGKIDISSGAKTDITFDSGNDMFGADNIFSIYFNDNKDGYVLKNSSKKITEDTHYAAFGFTVNSFDGLGNYGLDDLNIKLSYSEEKDATEYDKEILVTKELRHEKQLNAVSSSIKYLSESGYQSGKYDENLKESLEVAPGEKFYVVVDYFLSGGVKIEETDTASVFISVIGNDTDLKVAVEELPTSDYSVTDGEVRATVRVYSGSSDTRTFRFIIAVTPEDYGNSFNIEVKSSISASNISVTGAKLAENTVTVNSALMAASKLAFTLSQDGTYYIITGIGDETSSSINIPSRYKELPVKEIGEEAFLNFTHIKEVKLSGALEKIGERAFKGCTGIKSIVIPKNVTAIGEDAFGGLTDTEFYCETPTKPSLWWNWVETDAYVTWNYGDGQYRLNEDRGSYTYHYGGNGVNVSIPETYNGLPVTAVSNESFKYSLGLKKIKIPKTVEVIPVGAFDACTVLEKFVVSEENQVYKCVNNCLIDVNNKTLVAGGKDSVIPNDGSVNVIAEHAFYKRSGLESIVIPDSITEIGKRAFANCTALTEVTVGSGVEKICDEVFYGCTALSAIVFSESCDFSYIGDNVFYNTAYYNNAENWENGVLYIGKILIKANDSATATVKNGTVYIANSAFRSCNEITEIVIPESVKLIGQYAFSYCEGLQKVVIRNGLTEISTGAFRKCENLETVIIPTSVTTIWDFAFADCKSLTDIKYKGTKEQWDEIEKLYFWNSLNTVNTINFTVTYGYTGE